MRNTTKSNQQSVLDTARIEALRARIERLGSLCLNAETFRMLWHEGFTRRDVDCAIQELAAANRVKLDASLGVVCVRFTGTHKEAE